MFPRLHIAFFFWIKRPLLPGRFRTIDQIYPRTVYHFLILMRLCWWGILCMIYPSHFSICIGREISITRVSTNHSRRVYWLNQQHSPVSSFFIHITSFREGYFCLSRCIKILLIEWNSAWRTLRRRGVGPWAGTSKSSTKTSIQPRCLDFIQWRHEYLADWVATQVGGSAS